MNKIVYNACYGGFGLSDKAIEMYAEIKGLKIYRKATSWGHSDFYTEQNFADDTYYNPNYDRHDSILVEVVEKLGKEANGFCADLRIYTTNSNRYVIEDYDGRESVRVAYDDDEWTYIK